MSLDTKTLRKLEALNLPAGKMKEVVKIITGLLSERRQATGIVTGEFEAFWGAYPNKIGKRGAATAFERARKRVSFDELMEGLSRYRSKQDDRPWCNPATWLNQDRWNDQPAAVVEQSKFGNGFAANFLDGMNGHGNGIEPFVDRSARSPTYRDAPRDLHFPSDEPGHPTGAQHPRSG
jgi:hypothetical protein